MLKKDDRRKDEKKKSIWMENVQESFLQLEVFEECDGKKSFT